jgi:hypothetical protein
MVTRPFTTVSHEPLIDCKVWIENGHDPGPAQPTKTSNTNKIWSKYEIKYDPISSWLWPSNWTPGLYSNLLFPAWSGYFVICLNPCQTKNIENILIGIANPHRFSKYLTPISPKYDQWGIRVIYEIKKYLITWSDIDEIGARTLPQHPHYVHHKWCPTAILPCSRKALMDTVQSSWVSLSKQDDHRSQTIVVPISNAFTECAKRLCAFCHFYVFAALSEFTQSLCSCLWIEGWSTYWAKWSLP